MTEAPSFDGYVFDEDAMLAAVDLVGRCGATEFDFGFLDEHAPISDARWYADARYRGARIVVENQAGPAEAAEALAARLLHGGMCQGCRKLIAINDDPVPIPAVLVDGTEVDPEDARRRGLCRWVREARKWVRGCGEAAPDGSTREKLAQALIDADAPTEGIRRAREGYYDDYLSPRPDPISLLVADLEANGMHELAGRAKAGEFDGTKEESDAWARSKEGQATLAEFVRVGVVDETDDTARGAAPGPATRTDGRPAWRAKRRGKKPGRRR